MGRTRYLEVKGPFIDESISCLSISLYLWIKPNQHSPMNVVMYFVCMRRKKQVIFYHRILRIGAQNYRSPSRNRYGKLVPVWRERGLGE